VQQIPGLTGLSNVMQVAWVTPDLDRTVAEFSERYRIPEFYTADLSMEARLLDETGPLNIRFALANIDNMQIELIQPVGKGINRVYGDALPADGSHANVFHHVCVKIDGPIENWDAYVADLQKTKRAEYTGDPGPWCRFVYTDERATLGIWLEHVWYEPEFFKEFSAAIPTYHSR